MKPNFDYINYQIEDTTYTYLGTTTLCTLKTKTGFRFTGMSACLLEAEYDKTVGEEFAHKEAFEKLWAAEAYVFKRLCIDKVDMPCVKSMTFGGHILWTEASDDAEIAAWEAVRIGAELDAAAKAENKTE